MKRRNFALASLIVGVGFISACQQDAEQAPVSQSSGAQQPKVIDLAPAAASVTSIVNGIVTGSVVESMQAGGYTYAMVMSDGNELWAAGTPTSMAVGDVISFSTMIPMKDFHSKALNRDFPVLYFVESFTVVSASAPAGVPGGAQAVAAAAPAVEAAPVVIGDIEKVEGGYTIAEILAQRNELTDKPLKVRGQVTKVVTGIMGKNWVHISDSSGDDDFIVTSSGTASVGQVIVAEGKLSLNRDFGYGYKYDILMEDAAIK